MSILDEAAKIIEGDREKTYGDPGKNCRAIAHVWTGILGIPITAEQVCLCMAGLKLARLAHTPYHQDSQVDACGYLALLEKIQKSSVKTTESHHFVNEKVYPSSCFSDEVFPAIKLEHPKPGQSIDPSQIKKIMRESDPTNE